MLIFFKRKDYESELTPLEEFTKQCDQLTKKIRKYERKIEKQK